MDFLIHHMMESNARRFPEKEALVHYGARLTYADVMAQIARLAHGICKLESGRGERIGVYLDPSVPQVISFFGISKAGGVFVPINQLLVPKQVTHIANDCEMKGLITNSEKLHLLLPVLKEMKALEFLILVGKTSDMPSDIPVPFAFFEDLIQTSATQFCVDVGIEKDLAAILYTSGSTGKPKGVMISHAQLLAGSSIVSSYLNITEKDRILAVLPFSFDAGLNQVMTAFQQGGTLVLMTFVFARDIVRMLLSERITGLAGVPTLWSLLAQTKSGLQKAQLPDLRYITNTGGAMPQTVLATIRTALPQTKIFLMYGLTEAFRSTYLPPEELDRRPTSMGKAIPNTEILLVNASGRPCGPGEIGELIHRGPTVSMGYWGNPELTATVLRPHPFLPAELCGHEKVCYSGDLVKMDEEGFLYFVGRRDAMIKSAGFRISRTEIEETLYQSGWVSEAAVIGIPDDVLGQAIKALVVVKEGMTVEMDDLLAYCASKLPRYMVPKSLEFLDELPKTPNGKIDYTALQLC